MLFMVDALKMPVSMVFCYDRMNESVEGFQNVFQSVST